jgi:hypothetical protein
MIFSIVALTALLLSGFVGMALIHKHSTKARNNVKKLNEFIDNL